MPAENVVPGGAPGPLPGRAQPLDLLAYDLRGDPAAVGKRRHAHDGSAEVAKVARPRSSRRSGEFEEQIAGFLAERDAVTLSLCPAHELIVEVRLHVLGPIAQRRKLERPQIDAREQV